MLSKVDCVVFLVFLSFVQINCQNQNEESKTSKFLNCDIEKSSSEKLSECPVNAKCIELGKTNKGLCSCSGNYTVNEKYTSTDKNSAYCIERNQTANSTNSLPSSTENPTTIATSSKAPVPATVTQFPSSTSVVFTPSTKATQISTLSTSTPSTTTSANAMKVETTSVISSNESTTTKNKTEKVNAGSQAHHILGGIMLPLMFVLAFAGIAFAAKKYEIKERVQNYIRDRRSNGQPHQTRYDGLENDFDDDPLLI